MSKLETPKSCPHKKEEAEPFSARSSHSSGPEAAIDSCHILEKSGNSCLCCRRLIYERAGCLLAGSLCLNEALRKPQRKRNLETDTLSFWQSTLSRRADRQLDKISLTTCPEWTQGWLPESQAVPTAKFHIPISNLLGPPGENLPQLPKNQPAAWPFAKGSDIRRIWSVHARALLSVACLTHASREGVWFLSR